MFNINIKDIKEKIKTLTKKDIADFAMKYNVFLSKPELEFVYDLVKNNNQEILNNPKKFNLNKYKSAFSEENYLKLNNLYNKYSTYLNLIQINN